MGNLIKEKSPSGKVTKYTYDAAGNMTSKINPDGSKIKYDYDAVGALLKKKYSDGSKSVVYGYDAAGNKITMSDESGKSGYSYDELGRLKTATDAGGKSLTYEYDEYIGNALKDLWEGIRTFFTGGYKEADPEELEGIVVPGSERGTFVTYDLTYYLNDTNFNENSQVMYQYGSNGKEKASYIYIHLERLRTAQKQTTSSSGTL